jgi:hypothetical protein
MDGEQGQRPLRHETHLDPGQFCPSRRNSSSSVKGLRGATANFRAQGEGVPPSAVKARFRADNGWFDVTRVRNSRRYAEFRVIALEDCESDIAESVVEPVEVTASGCASVKIFVSISPRTAEVMSQQYAQQRIAPARHVSSSALLAFGKHKGRRFSMVAAEEPGYLRWMLREGAGSHIERACAELALRELSLAPGIRAPSRTPQEQIRSASSPQVCHCRRRNHWHCPILLGSLPSGTSYGPYCPTGQGSDRPPAPTPSARGPNGKPPAPESGPPRAEP